MEKPGNFPIVEINDMDLAYNEVLFAATPNHYLLYEQTAPNSWKSKGYNSWINYLELNGKKYIVSPPSTNKWDQMAGQTVVPLSTFRNIGAVPDTCQYGTTNYKNYCFYEFIFPAKGKLTSFGDIESITGQWITDNKYNYDFSIYVR